MDAHIALLRDLTALGKELLGYKDAELSKWVTVQFKIVEDKTIAEQQRADEAAKAAEEKAALEQQREMDKTRAVKERAERRMAREEDRRVLSVITI